MNTPGKNAKLLSKLADIAEHEGHAKAAEQIRESVFQLEVFELVGLKLQAQDNGATVRRAIDLVQQGVTSAVITGDTDDGLDKTPARGTTPSDFNISRN